MSPARKTDWSKWLPFIVLTVLQVFGGIWYASHLNTVVAQNAHDIAVLQALEVPRPEIENERKNTDDRLTDINQKLDILLTRIPEDVNH